MKNREKDIGGSNLPNNIKDIPDEAIKYEPSKDIFPIWMSTVSVVT